MPVRPPVLAEMVTGPPALTPSTRPDADTVAIPVLLELQEIVCPLIGSPSASLAVAVRLVVPPTTIVSLGGETSTEATVGSGGDVIPLSELQAVETVSARMPKKVRVGMVRPCSEVHHCGRGQWEGLGARPIVPARSIHRTTP